jgi:preprotein translocase subunit YajC
MRLNHKHKILLKLLGFVFLLVLMFVLNERQKEASKQKHEETTITVVHNDANTNSMASTVPNRTENTLPIKLIYNPKCDFIWVANHSSDKILHSAFVQWRIKYLEFVPGINYGYLIKMLSTTQNKEIQ